MRTLEALGGKLAKGKQENLRTKILGGEEYAEYEGRTLIDPFNVF